MTEDVGMLSQSSPQNGCLIEGLDTGTFRDVESGLGPKTVEQPNMKGFIQMVSTLIS